MAALRSGTSRRDARNCSSVTLFMAAGSWLHACALRANLHARNVRFRRLRARELLCFRVGRLAGRPNDHALDLERPQSPATRGLAVAELVLGGVESDGHGCVLFVRFVLTASVTCTNCAAVRSGGL